MIEKINSEMRHFVEENARVSDYIIPLTLWNIDHLFNILSNNIINKIESIPIPVTYVKDKKDGHLDSWRILS